MMKANPAAKTVQMHTPSLSDSSLEPWMAFTHC